VRLLVVSHQRDRAQATWLARSGVNLYRLLLMASRQLEKQMSGLDATMLGLPEGTDLGALLGNALWQMLPTMNTGMLRMIFASGGDASDVSEEDAQNFQQTGKVSDEVAQKSKEGSGLFSDKNFLDFDGDFSATVSDEDSKVNVNLLALHDPSSAIQTDATALQLYGLMSGQDNQEWLHERNLDPWVLIANLADWVDADNISCSTTGGYEDNLYNRLDSPYVAKNAPFDTKEEIRLVDGWQDEVYDHFANDLTVFGRGKINITTASPTVVAGLIRAYVQPTPGDAELQQIMTQLETYTALTSFKKGKDFVAFLEGLGKTVDPNLAGILTTSSRTFHLEATGMVGDSSATITTVLDFTSASGGGKVLYWRED
jgi:general secretion pathway protein K